MASRRAGTSGGCCEAVAAACFETRMEARAECLTFSLQIFKLLSGVVTCVFFGLQTNA